ncbi:MAG: WD40 repeat domain-containing protein, partial [Armatimonadota bacterium]|nr:WD40 repeat domain-containing protein [Armatimonadota bacterium]
SALWRLISEEWSRIGDTEAYTVQLSPQGNYLAAWSFIMDVRSGRKVWSTTADDTSSEVVAWATDETAAWVRFWSYGADPDRIERVSLPSGEAETVVEDAPLICQLSPDGRFLASENPPQKAPYAHVAAVGNPDRRLRLPGHRLASETWSPNGRYLWTTGPEGIAVVDAEAMETVTQISAERLGVPLEDWSEQIDPLGLRPANWTPDGSRVAFLAGSIQNRDIPVEEAESGRSPQHLVVASDDGATLHEVTRCDAQPVWVAGWLSDQHVLLVEDHERLSRVEVSSGDREVIFTAPGAASGGK